MIIARVRREWIVPFQRTTYICCQRRHSNLYTYPLFSENSFHCICPVCVHFGFFDLRFFILRARAVIELPIFARFFVVFCSFFLTSFSWEWCVPNECIFCCACTCIVRSWVSLLSRCRLLNEYGAVAVLHATRERQTKLKNRMKRNDSLCAQQTTFCVRRMISNRIGIIPTACRRVTDRQRITCNVCSCRVPIFCSASNSNIWPVHTYAMKRATERMRSAS